VPVGDPPFFVRGSGWFRSRPPGFKRSKWVKNFVPAWAECVGADRLAPVYLFLATQAGSVRGFVLLQVIYQLCSPTHFCCWIFRASIFAAISPTRMKWGTHPVRPARHACKDKRGPDSYHQTLMNDSRFWGCERGTTWRGQAGDLQTLTGRIGAGCRSVQACFSVFAFSRVPASFETSNAAWG